MFDFSAIDQDFLTRLFVGMLIYWVVGIFAKGIFEPIQAKTGRWLIGAIDRKISALKALSDTTETELDNKFIAPVAKLAKQIKILISS